MLGKRSNQGKILIMYSMMQHTSYKRACYFQNIMRSHGKHKCNYSDLSEEICPSRTDLQETHKFQTSLYSGH